MQKSMRRLLKIASFVGTGLTFQSQALAEEDLPSRNRYRTINYLRGSELQTFINEVRTNAKRQRFVHLAKDYSSPNGLAGTDPVAGRQAAATTLAEIEQKYSRHGLIVVPPVDPVLQSLQDRITKLNSEIKSNQQKQKAALMVGGYHAAQGVDRGFKSIDDSESKQHQLVQEAAGNAARHAVDPEFKARAEVKGLRAKQRQIAAEAKQSQHRREATKSGVKSGLSLLEFGLLCQTIATQEAELKVLVAEQATRQAAVTRAQIQHYEDLYNKPMPFHDPLNVKVCETQLSNYGLQLAQQPTAPVVLKLENCQDIANSEGDWLNDCQLGKNISYVAGAAGLLLGVTGYLPDTPSTVVAAGIPLGLYFSSDMLERSCMQTIPTSVARETRVKQAASAHVQQQKNKIMQTDLPVLKTTIAQHKRREQLK